MGTHSTYKKFDLNNEQVDALRSRFETCAKDAKVVSIVFQPTGQRGINGLTRGRVRVLVEGNPHLELQGRREHLFAQIRASVSGIFASADVSITHRPESFERSVKGDNRHFDAQRGYREYANFPMGRGQASGAPVRFDYSF